MGVAHQQNLPSKGQARIIVLGVAPRDSHFFSDLSYASGGRMEPFFSIPTGEKEVSAKETDIKFNSIKVLDFLTSCFNLTKEELASICKISRKTIYNWIDGFSEPRKAALERLFDLLMVAKAWKLNLLPNDSKMLRTPVLNGKSVLDLLKEDELNNEQILFAGSRLVLLSPFDSAELKDPFGK
ncbi:helix-turn-helix domain-containing protein [Legionella bozemanae]|uniref:helix-turn-helix domain-containing protein n=1 Tax=Legionella bozemanae TaxID=447 RepID=UPI00399D47B2